MLVVTDAQIAERDLWERKLKLGEFGMAMGKREKNAMARETWVSHVRFHVDEFCKQGLSKVDPTHYQDTAFHAAGKLLHRSPSQIFDTYYGR